MGIFDTLLIWPIINVLLAIYQVLDSINTPHALGFSIILLTIFIRIILYPLTGAQLKASKKMQDAAPHISKIRDRHKGDAKRIQAETMRVYKEMGINPVAGCLPILVQIPIIWALYSVLDRIIKYKEGEVITKVNEVLYSDSLHLKEVWDTTFFGLPLAQSPSQLMASLGPIILLVPIITGLFQFVQSKMLYPAKKKEDKAAKKPDDFATAFQTQATYIFPVMIAFFSFTFPIGLSLYWNTFTVFGIIQQYRMQGAASLRNIFEGLPYGKKNK